MTNNCCHAVNIHVITFIRLYLYDWTSIENTLSDWYNANYFKKYTLVMYGDSDLGKTEYAALLASDPA